MITAAVLFFGIGTKAQTNWKMDNSHSKVAFAVEHMMVAETEGKFKLYEAKVSSKSESDFTEATIEFSIDVNSINTDDENRDKHLKSDDFFNAEKFPKITFKSNGLKKTKEANVYELTGDLTIRDVTKKVTFNVRHIGKNVKDPWGNVRTGFVVYGTINRMDYNLKWNKAIEAGGVVVGENVKINTVIELIKA